MFPFRGRAAERERERERREDNMKKVLLGYK